jgi:hypothetical protein
LEVLMHFSGTRERKPAFRPHQSMLFHTSFDHLCSSCRYFWCLLPCIWRQILWITWEVICCLPILTTIAIHSIKNPSLNVSTSPASIQCQKVVARSSASQFSHPHTLSSEYGHLSSWWAFTHCSQCLRV